LRTALLGLVLLGLAWSSERRASGQPLPDRVEEFRKALRIEPTGPLRLPPDKKDADAAFDLSTRYRQKTLTRLANGMRSLGELSRALQLPEWTQSDDRVREAVDDQIRQDMTRRLEKGLREALASSDPAVAISAEGLIMEASYSLRRQPLGLKGRDPAPELIGMFNGLVPDLERLTGPGYWEVRGYAALALGQVGAASLPLPGPVKHLPEDIVPVLQKMLTQDNLVQVRRAAAQGMGDLLQSLIAQGTNIPGIRLGPPSGRIGAPEDFREQLRNRFRAMSRRIILALAQTSEGGLVDSDRTVRLRSVTAIQNIARLLRDLIPDGNPANYPPPARERTEAENRLLNLERAYLQSQFDYYKPLFEAFRAAAPALARVTLDPEEDVRQVALDAQDEVITCRRKMRGYLESVPPAKAEELPPPKEKDVRANPSDLFQTVSGSGKASGHLTVQERKEIVIDPVLRESPETLQALIKGLTGTDPYSRVLAVDAIESMGPEGAPAIPALIEALNDPFRFVRWAAARTLGRLAPEAAAQVVPALIRLVQGCDLDVQEAAATALEQFGPLAAPAVSALGEVAANGTPEVRIAAMKALAAIGTAAAPAIPQIAASLQSTNSRVRRTACDTLARFGTLAAEAAPSLKRLLLDTEPEVRKAASEALIKVLGH
jgi:HEAT repeat protein